MRYSKRCSSGGCGIASRNHQPDTPVTSLFVPRFLSLPVCLQRASLDLRCIGRVFELAPGCPVTPCHFFGTCSTNWQLANNLTDHFHYIAESTRELLLRCEEVRVQIAWRGTTKL